MSLRNLVQRSSPFRNTLLTLSLFGLSLTLLTGTLAIMEKAGAVASFIEAMLALLPFIVFATFGISQRTMRLDEFYWGNKQIPAWITGALITTCFLGGTGIPILMLLSQWNAYIGFAIALGWSSGFVLCAVLFASALRKFGTATLPEFLGVRFQSKSIQLLSSLLLILVLLPLLMADLEVGSLLLSSSLNITSKTGLLMMGGVLIASLVLGGVNGATWTQALQFTMILFAFLAPALLLGLDQATSPVLLIGSQFEGQIDSSLISQVAALVDIEYSEAGQFLMHSHYAGGLWPVLSVSLFLMLGISCLPHLIGKFFYTATPKASRKAAGYSLSFMLLFVVTGSAYPLLLANEQVQGLLGPNSLMQGSADGLIGGLVRTGIIAACLASCSAIILSITNTIGRDLLTKFIFPQASANQQLIALRLLLVGIVACGLYLSLFELWGPLDSLSLTLSLASSCFFPVLVLGCWWSRFQFKAALTSMLTGLLISCLYIAALHFNIIKPLFGLPFVMSGLLGTPAGFLAGIIVTFHQHSAQSTPSACAGILHSVNGQDVSHSFTEKADLSINQSKTA